MSIKMYKLSQFFSRKHSYLACLLLVYVAKYGLRENTQEAIYDAWIKHKPSRTTFLKLLLDLEEIGLISRRAGRKKSAKNIAIDSNKLIEYAGFKPLSEFIPSNCWVFKLGTFDVNAFVTDDDLKGLNINNTTFNDIQDNSNNVQ